MKACYGPDKGQHVKACRPARPLCRWRRKARWGLCLCPNLWFPHRGGSCHKGLEAELHRPMRRGVFLLVCLALASCVGSVGLAGDAESNCRDYQALLDASAQRCGGHYANDGLVCSDVLVFSVDWSECKAYLESATCAELARAKLPACQYHKIGAP